MNDKRIYLKVKIKSLMEESRIIRKEEGRAKDSQLREGLHFHRVFDVRKESRATGLAYGFIRGQHYLAIEKLGSSVPDWARVWAMVKKYGASTEEAFKEWQKGA